MSRVPGLATRWGATCQRRDEDAGAVCRVAQSSPSPGGWRHPTLTHFVQGDIHGTLAYSHLGTLLGPPTPETQQHQNLLPTEQRTCLLATV